MEYSKLTPYRNWLSLFVLVPLLLAQHSFAQSGLVRGLPAAAQKDFCLRWKEYLKYQKDKDWHRLYKLSISSMGPDRLNVQNFVEEMQAVDRGESKLVRFVPRASMLVNKIDENNVWLIEGCGFYRRNGRTVKVKSAFDAMLWDDKWYFGYVTVLPDAVGGAEQRCH